MGEPLLGLDRKQSCDDRARSRGGAEGQKDGAHKHETSRRPKLGDRLLATGEIRRGSLLQRTIRNPCELLGESTRQCSLRRELPAEVRQWLAD